MIAEARKKVESLNYIGALEEYYGTKRRTYTLALVPLLQDIGFASYFDSADGSQDIYGVIGSGSVKDGLPSFDSEDGTLAKLVWHEFSHPFVNPLTEKHRGLVAKYSSLFEPVAERMKSNAYGDWQTVVNESVIRAITCRLTYRVIGPQAGKKALQREKDDGFIYVEALYERLKEYESQRNKYRVFEDFYPRLLEAFEDVPKR